MAIELRPWDSADFIHDEADLAGYLSVVLEENDEPKLYAHSLRLAVRVRGTLASVERETGVPQADLEAAIAANDRRSVPVIERVQQAYERLAQTRLVA